MNENDIEMKGVQEGRSTFNAYRDSDLDISQTLRGKMKSAKTAPAGCCCCKDDVLGTVWYNALVILGLLAWAVLILLETLTSVAVEDPHRALRLSLNAYFVVEMVFRMSACGWRDEYSSGRLKYYALDALLLAASVLLDIMSFYPDIIPLKTNLVIELSVNAARIVVRVYVGYLGFTRGARRLVGGRKRRYIQDGFDLDLTYIEPQLIAMGLPSIKYEGLYRNPLSEVVRFFNTKHGNRFQIYNLCEERSYPEEGFKGRVRRFGFDDHNPPPLSLLVRLCHEASQFIQEDKKNVVAIHCKGGKGRTGVVTAAILMKLHSNWVAEKALLRFALMRTNDDVSQAKRVGVDGPSQRRYVEYWEKIRHVRAATALEKLSKKGITCKFKRLSLYNINVPHRLLATQAAGDSKDERVLSWTLMVTNYWYSKKEGGEEKLSYTFHADTVGVDTDVSRDGVSFTIKSWEKKVKSLALTGDVRFQVYPINVEKHHDASPFVEFWVHTSFLSASGQLTLRKADLDHVFRSTKIDNEFNVQLEYTPATATWEPFDEAKDAKASPRSVDSFDDIQFEVDDF